MHTHISASETSVACSSGKDNQSSSSSTNCLSSCLEIYSSQNTLSSYHKQSIGRIFATLPEAFSLSPIDQIVGLTPPTLRSMPCAIQEAPPERVGSMKQTE